MQAGSSMASSSTHAAGANNKQAHLGTAYQELAKELSSEKLKVVGGYTIGRVIGEGTFGSVHIATHRLTGTRCAVKRIPKSMTPQLTREIHHHRRLHHLHIVQLYEIMVTESHVWLVSELCSGGELFDYLVERGRMLEGEARRLFGELVVAVGWMHKQGVVHRDLKLENVLLDGELRVKLGDLGFSREWQRGRLMETFCGTTGYASPEMLAGRKYLGQETDVWSLGIILYTLLCGGLPFDDDDERVMQELILKGEYEEPEWLSQEARSLIRGMLQQEPSQRLSIPSILTHPWFQMTLEDRLPTGEARSLPVSPLVESTETFAAKTESDASETSFDFSERAKASSGATTPEEPMARVHSGEFSYTEKALELSHSNTSQSTIKNPAAHKVVASTLLEQVSESENEEVLHLAPAHNSRTPSRTKRRSVSSTLSLERRHSHSTSFQTFAPEDYHALLNAPKLAPFSTPSEKQLLTQLSELGFDTGQLMHSVENDACDASAAYWWILRAKQFQRGDTDEVVTAKQASAARRRERAAAYAREERAKNRDVSPNPVVTFADEKPVPTLAPPPPLDTDLKPSPTTPGTPNRPPLLGSPSEGSPRKNRSPSLSMLQRATSALVGGSWKPEEERATSPTKLTKPMPMPKSESQSTILTASSTTPVTRTPMGADTSSPTVKGKKDSLWTQFRGFFNEDRRKTKRGSPLHIEAKPQVVLSRGVAARSPHIGRVPNRRASADIRPSYSRRSSSINSRRSSINSAHVSDLEAIQEVIPRRVSQQSHGSMTPTSDRETSRPGSSHSRRRSSAMRDMRSPSIQSDGSLKTPASPLHNYHRRPPSGSASTRIRHIKVIPESHIVRHNSYASSRSNASSRASSIDHGRSGSDPDELGRNLSKAPLRDVFKSKDDEWEDEDPSPVFAGGLGQIGGVKARHPTTRASQHPNAKRNTKKKREEVDADLRRRIVSAGRAPPIAEEAEEEEE